MMDLTNILSALEAEESNNDSVICVIDDNMRIITIPSSGLVFGVENDKDVNKVTFEMNRYYRDNDMSEFTARVVYQNANGDKNYSPVYDMTATKDKINFSWTVPAYALLYEGDIVFAVTFLKTNEGVILKALNTTKTTAKCLSGLQSFTYIPEEELDDYIETVKSDIKTFADAQISAIGDLASEKTNTITTTADGKLSEINEINTKIPKIKTDGTNWLTWDPITKTYIDTGVQASGPMGPVGDAATISIGSVTGLDAGAVPTITNSGDEHNAIFNFGIPTASAIDIAIVSLFRIPRTGKVYTVKMPKFSSNPTTIGEKLDDNLGLICETSTDTIEGIDDYEKIPLFKWYNCNYLRDEHGHAYPTAIEYITEGYTTSGSADVGVIQMTPYVKFDDSNSEYIILSITDIPKDGYEPWCSAVSNGVVHPYVIHSKYFSGKSKDGTLRSQPNLIPARKQSYFNMITNYAAKGIGYFGASQERNTWQILFTWIKYARKSSQDVFQGCTSYNFQYNATIERSEKYSYFPLTNSQANNIVIGAYVSVGYGTSSGSNVRSNDSVHAYADNVKVLRIEQLDSDNKAIYLDCEPFDTTPHDYGDKTVPIILSSMHWASGNTNNIKNNHDGQINNNGKYPYRIQGCEYSVGGYFVTSDSVMIILENNIKKVYVSQSGSKRTTNFQTIIDSYEYLGDIYTNNSGESLNQDYWIGDITINLKTGVSYSVSAGSGSTTGVGDRVYVGGNISNNSSREMILGGTLGGGSDAGSSCLNCWVSLASADWSFLSAD